MVDLPGDLFNLGVGSGFVGGVAVRQKISRIMHHHHADPGMPNRHSVVDQSFAGVLVVPAVDIFSTDLKLKGSGDAVHRFHAVVFVVLAMLVEVDEARGDDQAFGVDRCAAKQGFGCYNPNLPV